MKNCIIFIVLYRKYIPIMFNLTCIKLRYESEIATTRRQLIINYLSRNIINIVWMYYLQIVIHMFTSDLHPILPNT